VEQCNQQLKKGKKIVKSFEAKLKTQALNVQKILRYFNVIFKRLKTRCTYRPVYNTAKTKIYLSYI